MQVSQYEPDVITQNRLSTHANDTPFFSLAGKESWCRVTDVLDGRTCHVVMDIGGSIHRFVVRLEGVAESRATKPLFVHWLLPRLCKPDVEYHKHDVLAMLFANPVYKFMRIHEYDRYGRCVASLHNSSVPTGPSVNEYLSI